jgi:hypothetical protein
VKQNLLHAIIFTVSFSLSINSFADSASSTPAVKFKYDLFASTSALASVNWKGQKNNSINFYSSAILEYRKNTTKLYRLHQLNTEISYSKYLDSIWVKEADYFYLNNIWTFNSTASIKNSFTFNLKTQIADTWLYRTSRPSLKKWTSGPLLPASVVAGYGLNIKWDNGSFINFSFAALKLNTHPHFETSNTEIKNSIVTDKVIYSSTYGLQMQIYFTVQINKILYWEYRTLFFTSGIDKHDLNFDLQNTVSCSPVKFLKIKFDQKASYDIIASENIQLRFELLLGISMGK